MNEIPTSIYSFAEDADEDTFSSSYSHSDDFPTSASEGQFFLPSVCTDGWHVPGGSLPLLQQPPPPPPRRAAEQVQGHAPNDDFLKAVDGFRRVALKEWLASPICSKRRPSRRELLLRIAVIESNLAACNASGESAFFQVKRRNWDNCTFVNDVVALKEDPAMTTVRFSFERSMHKFDVIVALIDKIKRLLKSNSICTIRDIYYQNTTFFRSMARMCPAMDDVCCLLDAPFWELGVVPSSKGLIAGSLVITDAHSKKIDCMQSGGVLLPPNVAGIKHFESDARFILVIEKDATFQKLLDEGALKRFGPCILVTGKGYPDVNTRLIVNKMWTQLAIPIFALVDPNPHGIEIMISYRFGSVTKSNYVGLAVPSMRWLGVHPSDIVRMAIPAVPLTGNDERKLAHLATRPYLANHPLILKEVQILLERKVKGEIEGVGSLSNFYLTDAYIPNKILCKDVI